jgi:hypothetical protein
MSAVTGGINSNVGGKNVHRATSSSCEAYVYAAGAGGFYWVNGVFTASAEL